MFLLRCLRTGGMKNPIREGFLLTNSLSFEDPVSKIMDILVG
jgi:hypothetical protein